MTTIATFAFTLALLALNPAAIMAADTNPAVAQNALPRDTIEKSPGAPAPASPCAEAQRPLYVPGEKWIYARNGAHETEEYLGPAGVMHQTRRTIGDEVFLRRYTADANLIEQMTATGELLWKREGDFAMFRFPMAVGKRWSSTYYGGGATRHLQVWVTACEQVTVPAGTFWAFKLETVNQRADREMPARETYWYAPSVKRMVKYYSPELELELELREYIPAPPIRAAR